VALFGTQHKPQVKPKAKYKGLKSLAKLAKIVKDDICKVNFFERETQWS